MRQSEFLHTRVHTIDRDIEQLRGAALAPSAALESLRDQVPLHLFQGDAALGQDDRRARATARYEKGQRY